VIWEGLPSPKNEAIEQKILAELAKVKR